jgi:hypothetical protein
VAPLEGCHAGFVAYEPCKDFWISEEGSSVGVRVMVEDVREQQLRHVSSAYLTFVAVDREGKRIVVPQVVPKTEHQRRRYEDAARRREMRADETQRKKEMRASLGAGWHV